MVTIGPMILLCLLAATFYIGSKKVSAGSGKGTTPSLGSSGGDNNDPRDRDCTADDSATNRKRGSFVIDPNAATTTTAVVVQGPVYPAALASEQSSITRIFREGAGKEADVEQVRNDYYLSRLSSGLLGVESQRPNVGSGWLRRPAWGMKKARQVGFFGPLLRSPVRSEETVGSRRMPNATHSRRANVSLG